MSAATPSTNTGQPLPTASAVATNSQPQASTASMPTTLKPIATTTTITTAADAAQQSAVPQVQATTNMTTSTPTTVAIISSAHALATISMAAATTKTATQPMHASHANTASTLITPVQVTIAATPAASPTIATTVPAQNNLQAPITAKNQTAPIQLRTQTHIITSVSNIPTNAISHNKTNNIRPSLVPSIIAPTIYTTPNRLSITAPSLSTTTTVTTNSQQQATTYAATALTLAESPINSRHTIEIKPATSKSPMQKQDVEMAVEPIITQNARLRPTLIGSVNLINNQDRSQLPISPTGQQIRIKSDIEQADEPVSYICCLMDEGIRCERIAGPASFSRRIQKIVGTKKMNFTLDPNVRHAYICEHHKGLICVAKKSNALNRDTQSNSRSNSTNNTAAQNNNSFKGDAMSKQHAPPHQQHQNLEIIGGPPLTANHTSALNDVSIRQGSVPYPTYHPAHQSQMGSMDMMMGTNYDSNSLAQTSSGGIEVDLQALQVNTLRRYKRHFRVQTRPGLNKLQLAESLKRHFRTMPIIEKEAITYFVYIVKCFRNKLDHNFKNG